MKRRVLAFATGAVLVLGLPAPAALAESGPCGEAPGPHCRPMDCEIVWHDFAASDIPGVPNIATPEYKCYN